MLVAKNISTGYVQKKQTAIVHDNLELSLPEGQLVALIGPNGSGKSTLLKTLSGLIKPLAGEVLVDGKQLANCSNHQKSTLISLVLTDRVVNNFLQVEQLVSFGRYPYTGWIGNLSDHDWQKIDEAIALCHLENLREKAFDTLSDGEKQRAMIARAIAQDTPIVILDEPTAHLDLASRVEILQLLRQLSRKTGKSIVVATHELELAINLADELWLMPKKGQFIAGLPEELVLSGQLSEAFSSALVQFNEHSGNFQLTPNYTTAINLIGTGLRYQWTRKALTRLGVAELSDAEHQLKVLEDGWELDGVKFSTLAQVAQQLKSL